MKIIAYWLLSIAAFIAHFLITKNTEWAMFITILCAIGYVYAELSDRGDKK